MKVGTILWMWVVIVGSAQLSLAASPSNKGKGANKQAGAKSQTVSTNSASGLIRLTQAQKKDVERFVADRRQAVVTAQGLERKLRYRAMKDADTEYRNKLRSILTPQQKLKLDREEQRRSELRQLLKKRVEDRKAATELPTEDRKRRLDEIERSFKQRFEEKARRNPQP